MEIIGIINWIIAIFFTVCYSYQMFYIAVSLAEKAPFLRWMFKKRHQKLTPTEIKKTRYGILIAARNEEKVIGQLIDSIKAQDYPAELIDIFVMADNCTDSTKATAEAAGAIVYERFNKELVGKGYALNLLLKNIARDFPEKHDAFLVFDADNILEPNYITEMNKTYSAGYEVATSYRNSKNYGDNWISSGYSLWFLRESRQLNGVRSVLRTSSEIKGTGFLIHKDIIKRQGGWIHHLLIEDVQFTIENVLQGEKVAYCDTAILYDEQPTDFMTSWWQRKRWCRGYLQILKRYTFKLIGAFFKGKGFSNYDMLMAMSPAFFISVAAVAVNILGLILTLILDPHAFFGSLLSSVVLGAGSYLLFALVALITVLTENKRIHATTWQKISSVLTFPIFMATYIPIAAASLFSGTDWKPIKHNRVDSDSKVSVPEHNEEKEMSNK